MYLADYHTHSRISPDARTPMEEMTAAAVRYLGAEVPEPDCDAGMLERFMREIYAMRPMPTRTLPKLYFKLFSPIHNRWRLRRVLRTSPWRYYYDTIRAQWNERFTLFR